MKQSTDRLSGFSLRFQASRYVVDRLAVQLLHDPQLRVARNPTYFHHPNNYWIPACAGMRQNWEREGGEGR